MNELFQKTLLFLVLCGGIYGCYLTSAIYHQKILKHAYTNPTTGQSQVFHEPLLFTIFPQLFAAILGKIIITVWQKESVDIPWKKCALSGMVININNFTYNQAVIYASFPAVVMAKSCSLLSVIIVGVFFTRVKDKSLNLTYEKLVIGLVATIGIILFNLFKQQQKSSVDHPISLISLSSLFLIISLIGDGFLPDIQAQIKSEFKPSSIDMYYHINKFTFLIGLGLSVISWRLPLIIDFMRNYEGFLVDVSIFSILNGGGQLFIYRMIKEFRQHIPPFVIAFRKCLTVLINIFWFHHLVNWHQMMGIGFVFSAVMWEVWSNYLEKKNKASTEPKPMPISQKENEETDWILKSIEQELKETKS